jgi:hypothetical protein
MLKIVDFAQFFGDLQSIRQNSKKHFLDNVQHPLGLLHSDNDVSGISTEKSLYQKIKKTPFFRTFNQIAEP